MRLWLVLPILAMPGCATGTIGQIPVSSVLEMRQHEVVMQQWDLSCGAAALATILAFQHNDPVPEKIIAQRVLGRTTSLRVQERGGFSLLDLKRFVDSRGYEGTGYGGLTMETLMELGPSIVPTVTNGYNHFVVFRGVVGDHVVIADPAFGNRIMRTDEFEEAWLEQLAFVVEGRGKRAGPGALAPPFDAVAVVPQTVVRRALR